MMPRTCARIAMAMMTTLSSPVFASAAEGEVRLVCNGKMTMIKEGKPTDYPIKGMLVQVLPNQVAVDGTVGMDGIYSVTRTTERLLFLSMPGTSVQGNINRLNGDIFLISSLSDDRWDKMVEVECAPAHALF